MANYIQLPSEIRQNVLRLVLIDSNDLEELWLKHLRCLVLVNKQCLEDVRQTLSHYAPAYIVKRPGHIAWPQPNSSRHYCVLPQPTTVCIRWFDRVDLNALHLAAGSPFVANSHISQWPLIKDWNKRISESISPTTKTVLIDATPMPGWMREKRPEWMPSTVDDRRIRRQLLLTGCDYMADFMKHIVNSSRHQIDLTLVGTYSAYDEPWINSVIETCHDSNIKLRADVDYVRRLPNSPRNLALSRAIDRLGPEVQWKEAGSPIRLEICNTLKRTYWRRSTEDMFETCNSKDQDWTSNTLMDIARFLSHTNLSTYDLNPAKPPQRKLVHRMIEDLGLWTETMEEDHAKFVRLSRVPIPRPWEPSPREDVNT